MIETIGFILTGLGLTASIVYYANILSNANKTRELQLQAQKHATETRQAQLYMQLFQKDTSTEFQKIVFNLSKIDTSNPKKLEDQFSTDQQLAAELRSFMFHLDGIGNMLRNRLITTETVSQIGAGIGPIMTWQNWKPWIMHYRETRSIPDYMSGIEYYAEEMVKIRQAKEYPHIWSKEQNKFI